MKLVIDIDGTLLDGDTANLDGIEFIEELNYNSVDYVTMTNAISPLTSIQSRLKHAGLDVPIERILSPIVSINSYISSSHIDRVFTIGSPGDIDSIAATQDELEPQLIVLIDFERPNFGYSTIQRVFTHIQAGVPIVSASGSSSYRKNGIRYVDTGAFVALFDSLALTKTQVLGKPSQKYFEIAKSKLGGNNQELTVIGDDWQTDMLGAQSIGANGILIKSGKYQPGDENLVSGVRCIEKFLELDL